MGGRCEADEEHAQYTRLMAVVPPALIQYSLTFDLGSRLPQQGEVEITGSQNRAEKDLLLRAAAVDVEAGAVKTEDAGSSAGSSSAGGIGGPDRSVCPVVGLDEVLANQHPEKLEKALVWCKDQDIVTIETIREDEDGAEDELLEAIGMTKGSVGARCRQNGRKA